MTTQDNFFDFNDAGEQKSFDVIPDNTIATVQLTIRPGGAGEGGWLRRSKDGASEMVDCEFTVVDGTYAKRKVFQLYTVHGTTPGHVEAAEISRKAFCAMLESAHGFRPDDKSEAAKAARQIQGYQDLDQLRFVVRLGVRPPQNGYDASTAAWRPSRRPPPRHSRRQHRLRTQSRVRSGRSRRSKSDGRALTT
jgi:hypothetical protein